MSPMRRTPAIRQAPAFCLAATLHWLNTGFSNTPANPDLVERLRGGLPLETADPSTYYVGGDAGYLTYPHYQYQV